jgi:hypothetical protein
MFFKIQPPVTKEHTERMGFDSEFNGANTTNCHFSLFGSPELTKAWELGNKRGAEAKQKSVKHNVTSCV